MRRGAHRCHEKGLSGGEAQQDLILQVGQHVQEIKCLTTELSSLMFSLYLSRKP